MLGPEQERITLARIRGVLFRHLRAGPPTGARQAAALADLAGVADGRVDLLAETTGVALGFHEDQIDAALYQGPRRCASPRARTSWHVPVRQGPHRRDRGLHRRLERPLPALHLDQDRRGATPALPPR